LLILNKIVEGDVVFGINTFFMRGRLIAGRLGAHVSSGALCHVTGDDVKQQK